MEENRPTLTTFDFNSPDVELGNENILSKLYGKVKTAVSHTSGGGDNGDSSGIQDDYLTDNDLPHSWYHTAIDAPGTNASSNYDLSAFLQPSSSKLTLTDTSEVSTGPTLTKNSLNDQFTSPSGSVDNITSHQTPGNLMHCSPSDLDRAFPTTSPAPTLSATVKAPATASVVITTATAQTSASTSTASSVGERSSSNNSSSNHDNTLHLPHPPSSSNSNDHVHFSPSPTRPLAISDMEDDSTSMPPIPTMSTSVGSNLTLPMTKSKSVDSDTQSIATNFSISNTNSLGKIMARLRGQKSDKEFWMPDEQCKECYKCRKQFTMFRRKHHCRFCGQIFCSKCANHIIPGKAYNQKGQVRICNFCYTEQCLDNNGDSSFVSTPATSRLIPSPSFKYDVTDDTNSDNTNDPISNDNEPYQPVIPSQNPPLAAPMMQIPTTAVKKSSNANYGNENSTTLALEIGDHDALSLLNDSRNRYHPHYHHPHHHHPTAAAAAAAGGGTQWSSTTSANHNGSSAQSSSGTPNGASRTRRGSLSTGGVNGGGGGDTEPGGFKRLLDAGTSLLNSRSRSNTMTSLGGIDEFKLSPRRGSNGLIRGTSSPSTSAVQQQQQQQLQQGCYMDHGGGIVVTENALSPFSCRDNGGNEDDSRYGHLLHHHHHPQDIGTIHDSNNNCDQWHRPSSALGGTWPSHSNSYSTPFRYGQSSSTTTGKQQLVPGQTSPSTGSDNESYDVQLRAKRTAELRGDITPLRKRSYSSLRRQSTSNSMGTRGRKMERRGAFLQVNTSALVKPDGGTRENWSPSSLLYPYSAYEGNGAGGTNSPIGLMDTLLPSATTSGPLTTLPVFGNNSNSNSNCNNINEEQQLAQDIKAKLLTSRHRRVSAPTSNTELSYSALGHARKLLRQLMDETNLCDLPDTMKTEWETVIMQLLIKMTGLVQPDVRAGDDMDVRHYVKIKKIPGGLPSDSFYVKGVMCSKNVAHKRMARNIAEPRILILLFSLDYSRVEMGNQLLSIRPVISQEREHISKLVGRIIALRPSLLLVKSTVSRLALEILLEANIPVVHNVKYSVIEAVARCTQASVVTSVDKLQGDIFFGQCGSFEIRTFLHEWIPNRRKTLLVFGDCAPELGGTIVLRGGTEETLKTVKTVMDFMVFVVHNLKLETALLRDSFAKNRGLEQCQIALHNDDKDASPATATYDINTNSPSNDLKSDGGGFDTEGNGGDNDQDGGGKGNTDSKNDGGMIKSPANGSDALHAFLKVYRDTVLSASQYVVFPPPYLLTKLKDTQDKLNELGKEAESTPHQGSLPAMLAVSPTRGTFGRHPGEGAPHGGASGGGHPSLPLASYSSSVMLGSKYELLVAKQHQLNRAWDAYLRESPDYVSPFYHQNIVVLYSNVCTVTTMPCYGPQIRVFEYYRYPSDIPLGQYLMDLFADALEPCPSSMCDYPTMNHYLSYAHGDARVNVITQHFECPVAGMNDKLLMWSYCKECKKATQVARVSENTWNYSFGKFLELFLYQQGVHCRADICPHEMGRHHVRFFGYMDMSVGFQYETIDLLEVSAPPTKLFMLSQVQMDLKDAELKLLRTKINKFYQSIIERNKTFPYDLVDPQQLDECKAEVEELSDRSLGTKKKVLQILQNIYATTAKSDTLTINWVRRILYQEVAEWDLEYTDLIRRYILFERELRKITASQLRKMFPADTTNAALESSTGEGDLVGNERIKRSSETTDLPLLGIALDGDDEKTVIGYTLKDITAGPYSMNTPPSTLPQLSSSPSSSPDLADILMEYDDDDDDSTTDETYDNGSEKSPSSHPSLLRPRIRRQLSRELNRELQLRFRVSDGKEEQLPLPIKTPGPTAAAMTPSRIPIPNINISSTSRPQLSPPIYDTLETSTFNPRLIITAGGNRIPMAPLKVPSSFELNVTTPGLRLMHNNKDSVAHRNVNGMEKRIYVPNETRICVPPPPQPSRMNQAANEPPFFMQQLHQKHRLSLHDEDQYHGGLQTQSLQHIPSMFKSQYANNDSGRRALGSIRRRTTAPSNNNDSAASNHNNKDMTPGGGVGSGTIMSRPGSRQQQGPFKSRLPRKKTYIQVYTQANDLVKEDMDDEFLVSDLDDLGDLDTNDNNENDTVSKSTSSHINSTITNSGPVRGKGKLFSTGRKTPLLLPMPRNDSGMDLQKLAEMNSSSKNPLEEPMDYFSAQAPYFGTSGTSPSPVVDKERINQSVVAALASVPQTPFSMGSILSSTSVGGRPSSMLERLDTGPCSSGGGGSSSNNSNADVNDNQLPLASDLLSSPAATSASGNSSSKATPSLKDNMTLNNDDKNNNGGDMDDQPSGKLPRNALIERSVRRAIDLEDVKHAEKSSFMKTITNFLTDNGTDNLLPLENPMNPMEHVLPDSFVVVREDEPSTIIAYTLSCDDYLKKMKEMRNSKKKTTPATTGADTHSLSDDTNTIAESFDDITLDQSVTTTSLPKNTTSATTTDNEMTQANIQETLLRESGSHMRYNFSDGTTKFFCKSFFTEQFDALRRQCGCDETYILSLASCLKWDPVGGKSGSAFLKTKDDRLLMKQMSRFELDAFLGFAPGYFQYLSKAFFTELPTVLAKIFGFYSIGYKNSSTGKSMRMDVLVMENLFYQRNVNKVFDLKGSMRNRHVESTGKEDEVLLDENLVELIFQSPLFIRAHSKEILRSSLHNDTLFLSGRNVMDYSLLVGIDEERHELVVGIVDFIRTFTWDKKLESWVKESVFLGGGGKEPTIVSPRLYRLRFRAAMERYFLMVPDVWALARQNRLSYPTAYHHHHNEDDSP